MQQKSIDSYVRLYARLFYEDFFGKVLPFWLKNGADPVYGGINTCLTRDGKVYSAEKSVWMQGRGGWMFAQICKNFGGSEECRALAGSALNFAKKHCIDPADGRLYFLVSSDGTPVRKRRYVFSEYFYIMANAEYYGLTRERKYLDEARRYHDMVMRIHYDPDSDPFRITPKFLPTAPTMRGLCDEVVLLLVTRTLRVNDPENKELYEKQERGLIDAILRFYYNKSLGTLLESVGPEGQYIGSLSRGRTVSPGHCMECAWYLLREAEELEAPELVGRAEEIYEGALRYGRDEKYGGLLYLADAEGYAPQAYEHDMKLWWVHTEAILAALKLFRVTGKRKYLEDFAELTDYAFSHFRDVEFGEWYGYLRRDGQPTEPVCKGNIFKGPFHVPRMYCEALKEFKRLGIEK